MSRTRSRARRSSGGRLPDSPDPVAATIAGIPTISGIENLGQTLTAGPALRAGHPTPTRTWQWKRSGTPVTGADSATYTLVEADVGQTLTVVQTETNDTGSDMAESAPTGTIGTALGAPSLTAVASLSGRTLTIGVGTLSGHPAPSVALTSLTLDGVDVSGAASLGGGGTFEAHYEVPSSTEAQTVAWVLTAGNSQGTDAASGSEVVDADLAAPSVTGLPTISGTEAVGQTLAAAPASVTGAPPPIRTWQWERDGVAIPGATASTYTLAQADEGTSLTVVQTETNGSGSDSAESAATGTIAAASAGPALLLFMGQSNMTRRTNYDGGADYPANAFEWDGTTETALSFAGGNPGGTTPDGMGPDLQTVIDLAAQNPGRKIVVLLAAWGGTGFGGNDWGPGDTRYDDAVALANSAITEYGIGIECAFWLQGEADAFAGYTTEQYAAAFDEMATAMRSDIAGADALPFVLSEIYHSNAPQALINAAIADTPNRLAHSAVVATGDLGSSDNLHYNAAGVRAIGSRFVDAIPDAAALVPVAPSLSGVPTISGTEETGEILTAVPAGVAGLPTPVTTWQWHRSGTPIGGATLASYALVEADLGETLTVVQTVTSTEGMDAAESAATGAIAAGVSYPLPDAESGATAHWLFGSDYPAISDQVSGRSVTVAAPPLIATNYVRPEVGFGNGLDTGIAQQPVQTMCAVFSATANRRLIIGSFDDEGGIYKNSSVVFNRPDVYGASDTGQAGLANTWYFVAEAIDQENSLQTRFVGNATSSYVATGTSGGTVSGVNIGLGNLFYNSSNWVNQPLLAEAIIFPTYKDAAALEAIYQRSRTRMTARGLSIT